MGEAKRRAESGITTLTLTAIRCHGLAVLAHPLAQQQGVNVALFPGKDGRPTEREFYSVEEVDALLNALRPHVLALCEFADAGLDPETHSAEHVLMTDSSIRTLRSVFGEPPKPEPEMAPIAPLVSLS